jgi:hypothetical protein
VRGSETVILELNLLSGATNHDEGAIRFGLDGKVYIGVGENANGANTQTLTNLLGKMLRINPDGVDSLRQSPLHIGLRRLPVVERDKVALKNCYFTARPA